MRSTYRLDARGDRVLPRARRGEGAASPTPSSRRRCKAALAQLGRDIAGRSTSTIREGPGGRAARRDDATRTLLAEGDPAFAWPGPLDEWDSLALLYTSGTTGDPKGVVYHHRGAYLNALGNALAFRLDAGQRLPVDAADVPLQRLDVSRGRSPPRAARTCACAASSPARVFAAIRDHGVTHLCGAPIVLNMLIHAPDDAKRHASTTSSTSPPAARRRRRR